MREVNGIGRGGWVGGGSTIWQCGGRGPGEQSGMDEEGEKSYGGAEREVKPRGSGDGLGEGGGEAEGGGKGGRVCG